MNYEKVNKSNWNKRLDLHLNSDFYKMNAFKQGATSLNDIELNLLGDINGLDLVHLQCHFGQDSLSLARMGANVIGVDLSDKCVEKAKELSDELALNADFICSNVMNCTNVIDKQFDIVFTSYGTITWLPELQTWAKQVFKLLKPGGKFIMVDFHPFIWMYDDDLNRIDYNYFNSDAITGEETGSYANKQSDEQIEYVCWNHALSETVMALVNEGLSLSYLGEYNYSPYDVFPGMIKDTSDHYRIEKFGDKVPLCFSIIASKS